MKTKYEIFLRWNTKFLSSESSVSVETELSEEKKFSVSLEKDSIFCFHIYT